MGGGKNPKGTDLSLQGVCLPLGGYSITILGRAQTFRKTVAESGGYFKRDDRVY